MIYFFYLQRAQPLVGILSIPEPLHANLLHESQVSSQVLGPKGHRHQHRLHDRQCPERSDSDTCQGQESTASSQSEIISSDNYRGSRMYMQETPIRDCLCVASGRFTLLIRGLPGSPVRSSRMCLCLLFVYLTLPALYVGSRSELPGNLPSLVICTSGNMLLSSSVTKHVLGNYFLMSGMKSRNK